MREAIGKAGALTMINDAATDEKYTWANKQAGLMKCTGDFCKWRINANYNINRNAEMTVGPFPGELGKASFLAFNYEALDVLCLEKLTLLNGEQEIDVLKVHIY